MLRFFILNIVYFSFSGVVHAGPQCSDFFKTHNWRDSLSRVFIENGNEKIINRVYDRPTNDDLYPKSLSTLDLINQEVLQLELISKLIWRLQSPLQVVKVRAVKRNNKYGIKVQRFENESHTWVDTSKQAPTMILEHIDGIRFIDVIQWLNGEKPLPASWLTRENAIEKTVMFNKYLTEFSDKLQKFAKDKIELNDIDTETASKIKYDSLDVTLIGQKSYLEDGRLIFSIAPSNVVLTPDGNLIIISPF